MDSTTNTRKFLLLQIQVVGDVALCKNVTDLPDLEDYSWTGKPWNGDAHSSETPVSLYRFTRTNIPETFVIIIINNTKKSQISSITFLCMWQKTVYFLYMSVCVM